MVVTCPLERDLVHQARQVGRHRCGGYPTVQGALSSRHMLWYGHGLKKKKPCLFLQQSMGDNKPESQSLNPRVQETTRWARELSASCREGCLEPGGQQGRASSGRCQGRSAWHGAALWGAELGCLSSGLEPASVIP